MRVVKEGCGLNYNLRFLYNGAWRHEVIVPPHNMEKMITTVWQDLNPNEILYEDVANSRVKAIRFPGRKY